MLARPEIGSREHILLWLAGKPEDEKYNWHNHRQCACGQYSIEMLNGTMRWQKYPNLDGHGPQFLCSLNYLAYCAPRTWGALYERARNAWGL